MKGRARSISCYHTVAHGVSMVSPASGSACHLPLSSPQSSLCPWGWREDIWSPELDFFPASSCESSLRLQMTCPCSLGQSEGIELRWHLVTMQRRLHSKFESRIEYRKVHINSEKFLRKREIDFPTVFVSTNSAGRIVERGIRHVKGEEAWIKIYLFCKIHLLHVSELSNLQILSFLLTTPYEVDNLLSQIQRGMSKIT